MLREQVRCFVERDVLPHADDWEAAGKIPREVFRKLGDLGVLGMRCPVEHGGSGLDALASVVLAEEFGRSTYRGFAVAVLVHTDMASPHLINSGRADQLARYVPGIVSGEIVTAVAVTEPDAGSHVQGIRRSPGEPTIRFQRS
jgi:acyl-CoA dehydrogenase